MKPTHILIHYGEIALKLGHREFFEGKLRQNIRKGLTKKLAKSVDKFWGRFLITLQPDVDIDEVVSRLKKIPGIAYMAPAYASEQTIEQLKIDGLELMQKLPPFKSFRVECRRSNKRLPFKSLEVARHVGGYIKAHFPGVTVSLEHPEAVCNIQLFDNQAIIYSERIEGLKGLPVGTAGKVIALLSAGIDSPVAAYQMMRRGCKVCFVHFHSYPFTDKNSIYNSKRLVEQIVPYQLDAKIYFISLAKIQERIIALAPVRLRLILYRRMMLRLAEKVASRERGKALITGESVGQVASQTLGNLRATSDAVKLPILRPLIGYDKQDIIDVAHELGTYDISIEPFADCCTYMIPKSPETNAKLKEVWAAEEALGDIDELIHNALKEREVESISLISK